MRLVGINNSYVDKFISRVCPGAILPKLIAEVNDIMLPTAQGSVVFWTANDCLRRPNSRNAHGYERAPPQNISEKFRMLIEATHGDPYRMMVMPGNADTRNVRKRGA